MASVHASRGRNPVGQSCTHQQTQGAGSPSWQPPDFYIQYLLEEGHKDNPNVDHQYTRTAGSHTLTKAIATFLSKVHPDINPKTEITMTKGAN